MGAPLHLAVQTPPRKIKARRGASIADFSIPAARELADEIMSKPCAGYIPRAPGKGKLLQRFVLPLELCKTTNALISIFRGKSRRAKKGRGFSSEGQMAALEEKVFHMMWIQHPHVRAEPLPGRPQLRIVRFSSVEADEGADGMKLARDLLRMPIPSEWDYVLGKPTKGRKGFGFLVDDAPKFVETVRWWEKAPGGKGFGLLEIWSGTP